MRLVRVALACVMLAGGGPAVAQDAALCIDGHPAPRRPGVTYGGLPPRHGFERDHCVPLGLGGADDKSNVWYEDWPEAKRKNWIERQTIDAYCAGRISLEEAQARFIGRCQPGMW